MLRYVSLSIYSLLFLFLLSFDGVLGVTCHTCKDTIPGCAGGNACPLLAQCITNAAALVAGSMGVISFKHLIPSRLLGIFARSVMDRIVFLAHRSTHVPFDPAGKTATQVYSAALQGQIGKNEAQSALVTIMDDPALSDAQRHSVASTAAMMAAMTVPSSQDRHAGNTAGCLQFLVATLLKHISTRDGTVSVSGDQATTSAATRSLELRLVPPVSEFHFYEMLNLFVMFSHAFGVGDCSITTAFISQVVHEKMRRRNYSWMMGYELFMVFLRAVDDSEDPTINLATIHSDGGLDGHAEDAEAAGVIDYGATFRKTRVVSAKISPGNEGSEKWNGRDTPSAQKACISYNRGKPHPATSLTKNGTCKFKHVCFKWISGAGKDAICGSRDHVHGKCDHPDACESAATE